MMGLGGVSQLSPPHPISYVQASLGAHFRSIIFLVLEKVFLVALSLATSR